MTEGRPRSIHLVDAPIVPQNLPVLRGGRKQGALYSVSHWGTLGPSACGDNSKAQAVSALGVFRPDDSRNQWSSGSVVFFDHFTRHAPQTDLTTD